MIINLALFLVVYHISLNITSIYLCIHVVTKSDKKNNNLFLFLIAVLSCSKYNAINQLYSSLHARVSNFSF